MRIEVFLKNKIERQIKWNGREFIFKRHGRDVYNQTTNEVIKTFKFNGFFHQAGGYGGMLNIEIYERDGSRTVTKLKPMILCLYDDAKDLLIDDEVVIGNERFVLVDKSNVQNLDIAFELSLEKVNEV